MKVSIFVSYSHRDRGYLAKDELLGFLTGLERDCDVRFWLDENLTAGSRWDQEIQTEISNAHIALVLVSQAFLDSPYCIDVEIGGFLQKRREEGLRIFPVVLSACEWDRYAWLAERQFLPGGDETIEEHYSDPGRRKRLYLRIRKELRQLVEQVQQSQDKTPAARASEALAERRRVTLLNCGLSVEAGDDPLSADDEIELLYEATPLFRDRVVAQIQAVEGHVVSDSSGAIVASFGYPVAHEDAGIRAIRAGMAIVNAIGLLCAEFKERLGVGLSVRVGIQSGFVISSTGVAAHRELQQGETQAAASLLEVNAAPNTVVVGDATRKLVNGFFRMDTAGEYYHPAMRRKIRGWQVLEDLGVGSKFHASRLQGLTPIVGRARELGIILDAWRNAQASHGKMSVITADAGVGKSRLLEEVRQSVASQAHYLVDCQCSEHRQNSALFPVAQALRNWLRLETLSSPDTQREQIHLAVARTGLPPDDIVPFVADLLGVSDKTAPPPAQSNAKLHKERTFEAILMLMVSLASDKPVLLTVEDLHWADASTEELLGLLLEEMADVPILVVCTSRPDYQVPASWISRDHFIPVKIGPLSVAEVTRMVSRLTGGKSLPGEITMAICERTEGYPLFVEDLTRMVLESDLLEERETGYVARRDFRTLAIPDTLEETLMARLSRVAGARLVAQLGAVIGREFSYEMIEAIAPLEPASLKELLGKLVAAGVLYRRGLMTRTHYTFKHALVKDALYQSVLKRERRRYHKEIAEALESRISGRAETEPEVLAHHFCEAGLVGNAVKYWIAAGEIAIKNCANVEAIGHATDAMAAIKDILDPVERGRLELQVQVMQGPALLAVKGWAAPELGSAYTRANELLQYESNRDLRFRIGRGLWAFASAASQLESAVQTAQELMRLGEEADSDDYRLEAHAAFSDSYFWMGQPSQSAWHAERGLSIYDHERHHTSHSLEYGEDPSTMFHHYGALCHWMLGNTKRAEEIVELAIRNIERYTHLFSRGFLLNGIAWYYVHTGNPALARHYGQVLKQLSTENDFPPWLALARTHCGWAMAAMGDVEGGIAEFTTGMSDLRDTGIVITKVLNCALLGEMFLNHGLYAKGLDAITEGLEHGAAAGERHYWSELYRIRAELLRATGASFEEIEENFRKAISIAREQQAVALEKRAVAGLENLMQSATALAVTA